VSGRISVVALLATAAVIVVTGTVAPVESARAEVYTITLPIHPDYVDEVYWTDTWGAPRSGGRSHIGVDMMADKMVPVVAANDAVVTWGRFDNDSGSIVRIRDAAGWEYQYIHINNDTPGTDDKNATCLQAFSQKLCDSLDSRGRLGRGVEVAAGEIIGYLGDGGNAEWTAPHLHFEVYQPDGAGGVTPVNPTPFVDAAKEGIGVEVGRVGPFANARVAADEIYRRLEGRDPRDDERSSISDAVGRGGLETALAEVVADNPSAAMVDRLYLAFFQRLPDEEGWDHWIEARADGHRLEDIAEWFAEGDEFANRYGGVNFKIFLDRLYADVLNRPPDGEGRDYWLGLLRDGEVTRGTVVVYFTESAEMLDLARYRSELTVIHRALGLARPDEAQIEAWESLRSTADLEPAIAMVLDTLE
jgi:hypothetical protein